MIQWECTCLYRELIDGDEFPEHGQEAVERVGHRLLEVSVVVALHRLQDALAAVDLPDTQNHLRNPCKRY